jgi:hypothetical protein
MLSIQPRRLCGAEEELRSIGSGTRIGHRQDARSSVLQLEVFIRELCTINRLSTRSVVVGEVPSLAHEVRNDTVERRALVTEALLTSAQSTEIL